MKSLPIRLIYFGFNYPHNFISQVWEEDKNLIEHLESKFKEIYHISVESASVFPRFFTQLSTDNQQKLVDWIDTNYQG